MRRDGLESKRGEAVQSMPKQPPVPIHIRIDTQEQRSGIPALLAAMPQVHMEVTPLRMGDYYLRGMGSINARAVIARFRSLHDLLGADATALASVPGVSPARAAALEQLLHAALPSPEAGGAGEA